MNKSDLIEAIAECSGLTKAEAKRAIDCYHECVSGALKKGNRVALVGFGSFSVTEKNARVGRNPQTGKPISIPRKKVVKFRPGIDLLSLVK
ncbi:MAG: DNA-binding protein [Bacteroidetes bacterium GWC2_33_15]|nr:MAG: DNA-binding protein [Bacteroidetes bacterium GWA2_33_15]OFX48847.1 MAG: DNA-binding protein [Bacteroidetes bacterium GWC2_33_15]OFX66090.1 MAG: DNA-binding protein [Bacteroidetes bacterium GWB2_32_14]OFX68148.1 MAG: DNA-binding protein [Bacteroidetes bacterium GWD2_33_33]HAN17920.1 DNA-binding protein [Bacteroidales bacterium]